MANWKQRVRSIQQSNPSALPDWLRKPSSSDAWYRVEWQTENGVAIDLARRPLLTILGWLNRRSLLTENGLGTLRFLFDGRAVDESLTRSMVSATAAAFLDEHWNAWWSTIGILLCIDMDDDSAAVMDLDKRWSAFNANKADEQ